MKLSTFSINTIFVVLMLLGLALMPRLSLQLNPSSRSNELSVSFWWSNASPELLEMEVTSKLEGIFSRTKGLNEITSQTNQGYGRVTLSIDKNEDIDATKLYLSSLVRSILPGLPDGVGVSQISGGEIHDGKQPVNENATLLTYIITGPGSTQDVAIFAEDHIASVVSVLPDVEQVAVTGAVPFEWVLHYEQQQLDNIGVNAYDIASAIRLYYTRIDAGKVLTESVPDKKYSYIVFKGNNDQEETDLLGLPIKTIGDKVVRLHEVATLDYREKAPSSYYRINGLNRININISSGKNANTIELAATVKKEMKRITEGFPKGYNVELVYDSSKELKDELDRNMLRTVVTILVLLLFVYLTSRNLRYLFIVTASLTANILIGFVFYYFFRIEIHLYTLAGITISFSIIIDNVIVMADHYRHHHNRRVFMAVMAATLTTVGALAVIFNMDNTVMHNMWGFSAVIIINLFVSLTTALFFVPALMDKFPLQERHSGHSIRRKRQVVRFTRKYIRVIRFFRRFRWWLAGIAILGFGLPVFLIPTTIDRDKKYAETYNRIFSSEFFLQIKPYVDKSLGGSLRLFMEGGGGKWLQKEPEERVKTTLNMVLTMPHGATLQQMNDAFIKVENFLSGFEEVELFTSDINSPNRGNMRIQFKEEAEMGGFPEVLKNELIRFANSIGNADADISGVGRGFSNKTSNEYRSESLTVSGYNYKTVVEHASRLKDTLAKNRRVAKLYIGSERNPEKQKAFAIEANKEKLARNNSDINQMLNHLNAVSYSRDVQTNAYINRKLSPVVIRPVKEVETSVWELQNRPMQGNKSAFRLNDVAVVTNEQSFEAITKKNQEYEMIVQYDFIGDYMLSNKVKERVMKEFNREMPIGFRVKEAERNWYYWSEKIGGIDSRIWYIVMVITIIFFICAVLLESLKQALMVVLIAPISFIGCFLGFYFFGLQFNEGGLAAFILMCGLSVNAVLYVINDYNNKIKDGCPPTLHTYLRAFHAKIIPILLTIFSTILGFIPFLVGQESSGFWFTLALGTMSGLCFSLLVLMIYLPVFFKGDKKETRRR